jgi:hypothetical protein
MERPNSTITIGDREIKMSYGLFNDLQRMVPDVENAITTVLTDPYARDYLVRRALTPVKKSVEKIEDLIDFDELDDIGPNEVSDLLKWITEHLLYFFQQQASELARLGNQFKEALPQLALSTSGSQASA